MSGVPSRVCWGVFFIALAALLFEVCLTRIFSVTLWYHFGFLAIALAMLGGTAAAVSCFVFRTWLLGDAYQIRLGWSALLFGLAAPTAMYAHFHSPLDQYNIGRAACFALLGMQFLLLFLVFFAAGLCIAIALARHATNLNKVYFFDLLGAAGGALLFIPLLSWFSAPALVFAVSAAGGAASLLFFGPKAPAISKVCAGVATLAFVLLLLWNDRWGLLQVLRIKTYRGGQMQMAERGKVYERWSPVARVAVFQPVRSGDGSEKMHVTNDGGAPTNLHKFDGDIAKLHSHRHEARQIAHHLKDNADVLIIGSAGGSDVRAALAFGQREITAVEINPVTVNLVSSRYADYIGRIFEHPRVKLHQAEGRNFLTATSRTYDLIQVTMIDSWASATAGAYVFNEANLYTTDAIADYLSHLKPEGILSITRYHHNHEALRLVNVVLAHLQAAGVADPHLRLAVALEKGRKRGTVLAKNGVFTPQDAERLCAAARDSGNDLIYAPYVADEELLSLKAGQPYRDLIYASAAGAPARERVVSAFPQDISAVGDDRPFFFFMDGLGSFSRLGASEYDARRMALPILYGAFLLLAMICVATVVLPLALGGEAGLRAMPYRCRAMTYFGCLGVGFMVIELGLMHKFTVLLGYPAYSFITVVTTLLLFSGLGSWLSGRGRMRGSRAILCLVLLLVAAGAGGGAWALQHVHVLRTLDIPWRTACVVGLLAPLGLCMGICFPLGMAILRELHPAIVPWGWGVNGVCGVFGCAATLVIALNFGLTACLLVGSACYLAALACMATIRAPAVGSEIAAVC